LQHTCSFFTHEKAKKSYQYKAKLQTLAKVVDPVATFDDPVVEIVNRIVS
jgi:hypothetical protein